MFNSCFSWERAGTGVVGFLCLSVIDGQHIKELSQHYHFHSESLYSQKHDLGDGDHKQRRRCKREINSNKVFRAMLQEFCSCFGNVYFLLVGKQGHIFFVRLLTVTPCL